MVKMGRKKRLHLHSRKIKITESEGDQGDLLVKVSSQRAKLTCPRKALPVETGVLLFLGPGTDVPGKVMEQLKRDCRILRQRNCRIFELKSQAENALWSLSEQNTRESGRKVTGSSNYLFKVLIVETLWRRARDSNPRYPFGYVGFQDRCHQPLGQLSAAAMPMTATSLP